MKHRPVKVHKFYSIRDGKLEIRRHCPRCGTGVFLAKHENRWSCGKCQYAEIIKGG